MVKDWDWIGGLVMDWQIGNGLADWHWIGRLVLDWHMSQSLPLDWGLGKDCIASEDW